MGLLDWLFGGGDSDDKIEVEQKSSWGSVKWRGKCPRCKTEYAETDKKDAIKRIERCLDNCKKKARRAEEDAEDKAKRQLAQTAGELKRLAKNKKCPFCKSKPCKGSKPKCAAVQASTWKSISTVDPADMASYDEQLKWYKDNME